MNLPDNFGWKYVYELPFFLLKIQCFSGFNIEYTIEFKAQTG